MKGTGTLKNYQIFISKFCKGQNVSLTEVIKYFLETEVKIDTNYKIHQLCAYSKGNLYITPVI